jgi:uncharacterized repeat protein (TIGR01451 family)
MSIIERLTNGSSKIITLVAATLLALAVVYPGQVLAQPAQGVDVTTHKFRPAVPLAEPQPGSAVAGTNDGFSIHPAAVAQINALLQDKESRTPAQRKISSQLIYTARMMRGQAVADGVPALETGVDVDDADNMLVDITATVTDNLLAQLRAAGANILSSYPQFRSIRALVPASQLEPVAALPAVTFISPKQEADTARMPARVTDSPGTAVIFPDEFRRSEQVLTYLEALLPMTAQAQDTSSVPGTPGSTGQGSQTAEGDLTHRAFDARMTFGVNGTGLKIGVLSDGVTSLAASQELGDLPNDVTVLSGQTGSGDEGTAMLEIIHDMAPGAKLYFATADNGIASFAQNIHGLRTAGCDIIVDDVFYFIESPFADGQTAAVVSPNNSALILQAVNDVTSSGALFFSSAGNEGNLDLGSAGVYEGDFTDGGALALLPGTLHNFGAALYDTISATGGALPTLFWSDPLGASTNDYDLYLLNATGTAVLAASTNIQNGTQDPVEIISSSTYNVQGNRLVVFKKTGAANRYFHLNTFRGRLAIATAGETHGHSHAANAYSVAATPAYQPWNATVTPVGPWPSPFTVANKVEQFSSDGLRRIFFHADGTPYTPGNFSSSGGITRQKPDIAGADGVSVTGVGGFGSPFYGTSAAAVAALVKAAQPTLSTGDMYLTLTGTAIDIMDPSTDRNAGHGIVMAYEAIKSLGVPGVANPELGTITATDNPGNGNGLPEAGEGVVITIHLQNTSGVADAKNISATLTSSTPGVYVTLPGTSAFADLPAGSSTGTNLTPFTVTLASDYPCGQPATFTLTVTYTGGPSPRVLTFSIPTGPAAFSFSSTLDATPPTPVTGITTATGTQTGRISRNGVASTCATTPKPWPGYGATTGSRAFDGYTFTATRSTCLAVTMTAQSGVNLYTAAYQPNINPADVQTAYYADAGSSSTTQTFGIAITAGLTYSIIVHEVNTGGGVGAAYNLSFSGCATAAPTPNQLPVARARDVTVTAGPSGTASASVNNGSYDPDGDAITITQVPPGPYAVGATSVLLTVTDSKGAVSQASAVVTVVTIADLAIQTTHSGTFAPGQTGATYTLTVSNIGSALTAGTVTVTDALPAGLTATGLTGTGWSCTLATLTCTRSDALAASSSYPPLTLTVSVAVDAPVNLVNSTTVSGGGETNLANNTSDDPTTVVYQPIRILAAPPVYYPTIQSASTSVSAGGTIQLQAQNFSEELTLTTLLSYTIMGGYDAGFVATSSYSTVSSLEIRYGTVTIGNIIIH